MKLIRRGSLRDPRAFTLVELVCVLAIISILAGMLLPALQRGGAAARRIECVNQLHQLGIGFHSFAHDHNSQFPMSVPRADGGSREFVDNAFLIDGDFYFGYRHFQALAGVLDNPRVLVCPVDTRLGASSFDNLGNTNISYFVAVSAQMSDPTSILAGDRNLRRVTSGTGGTLVEVETGQYLSWDESMHQFRGNLLFSDAHVEQRDSYALAQGPGGNGSTTLVMPTLQPPSGVGSGGDGGTAGYVKTGSSAAPQPPPNNPGAATAKSFQAAAAPNHTPRKGHGTAGVAGKTSSGSGGTSEAHPSLVADSRGSSQAHESTNANVVGVPAVVPGAATPQTDSIGEFFGAVFEPFIREIGLSLYLLLLMVVLSAIVFRRFYQARGIRRRRR